MKEKKKKEERLDPAAKAGNVCYEWALLFPFGRNAATQVYTV